MAKILFSWENFLKIPIVGIVRNLLDEEVIQILSLYESAGLNTIEITMNTPNAKDLIRYAKDHFFKKLNVGAGTVCNLADLEVALEAGAQFIVTPIVNRAVINQCVQKKIPIFCGAFTPTEIYTAWELGADMVKIFPATSLGPSYIKEIKGPLNQIKLLPTGGVNVDNCLEFLTAGSAGLGIGSQLFNVSYIREKNWKALSEHFALFVNKINDYQKKIK